MVASEGDVWPSASAAQCGYARVAVEQHASNRYLVYCSRPLSAWCSSIPHRCSIRAATSPLPLVGRTRGRATNPRSGFLLGRLAGGGKSPAHTRPASRHVFFSFFFLFFPFIVAQARGGSVSDSSPVAGARAPTTNLGLSETRLERTSGPRNPCAPRSPFTDPREL